MTIRTTILAAAALAALITAPVQAQWVTLKGKFKVDKAPPPAVELKCDKDPATCCAKKLVDDSLVVSKDLDLSNVFIYVRTKDVKYDPSLEKDLKPVTLDNKDCVFQPHAVAMWNKQKLILKNSDNVGHNTNFNGKESFNILVPEGQSVEKPLTEADNLPKPISCSIHGWMKANLLVRDNPYFAVTAADGTFEIKNLPKGANLEYALWHERSGYLGELKFNGIDVPKAGKFNMSLGEDKDIGTITISTDKLKAK